MTLTTTNKKTQDLQQALRQASAALAEQISDLTSLKVRTLWVKVSEDGAFKEEDARPVAATTIELDGDTTMIIPMRDENGVLVRDDALLEVHLGSVKSAMEYRQKLIETIIDTVRQARER